MASDVPAIAAITAMHTTLPLCLQIQWSHDHIWPCRCWYGDGLDVWLIASSIESCQLQLIKLFGYAPFTAN